MRTPPASSLPALILALAYGLAGCASPPEKTPVQAANEGRESYDPNLVQREPESIGSFLAELDKSMRAWTKLMFTAGTEAERRKATVLQKDLMRRTYPRMDELIAQLEGGPVQNRVRAAGALGFTKDPGAQSPLLAALHDESRDVICNALLGLTMLELPDTPLDRIAELYEHDPDPEIRANAAYAARAILEAGGSPPPS